MTYIYILQILMVCQNILLEIATKGLPIIAPNVGGVGDFIINNETGILIDDHKDVDTY